MAMIPSGDGETASDNKEAITYCQERGREGGREGWLVAADGSEASHRRLSHPALNKEHLFHQEGKSLEKLLVSGLQCWI